MKPLCIELFAGLHGWGAAFADAGYRVVGFDIADMSRFCGQPKPAGCDLVLQDVLTLHGSQFRDAAVIVASPPCQNYSYLAMPWSRSKSEHSQKAKAMRRKWETEGPDNRLFDACFRIRREASEAAGRCIPLIVENVRGAQPWVGRAKWSYGSFYLWGDVPALMPFSMGRKGTKPIPNRGWTQGCAITLGLENYAGQKANPDGTNRPTGSWFRIATSGTGNNGRDEAAQKVPVYSDPRRNGGKASHLTSPQENAAKLDEGTKQPAGNGDWFSKEARDGGASARFSSKSNARKIASAMIARIPYDLASHIAQVYLPVANRT